MKMRVVMKMNPAAELTGSSATAPAVSAIKTSAASNMALTLFILYNPPLTSGYIIT